MSVPSPSDVQATYADTLVDEWITLGVTDAAVMLAVVVAVEEGRL